MEPPGSRIPNLYAETSRSDGEDSEKAATGGAAETSTTLSASTATATCIERQPDAISTGIKKDWTAKEEKRSAHHPPSDVKSNDAPRQVGAVATTKDWKSKEEKRQRTAASAHHRLPDPEPVDRGQRKLAKLQAGRAQLGAPARQTSPVDVPAPGATGEVVEAPSHAPPPSQAWSVASSSSSSSPGGAIPEDLEAPTFSTTDLPAPVATSGENRARPAPAIHDESLIEALPVKDESNRNLQVAEAYSNSDRTKGHQKWYPLLLLVAALLLVGGAVGAAVAIVLANDDGSTEAPSFSPTMAPSISSSPTNAPTLTPETYVLSLLPNSTRVAIEEDALSPQARGLQFLLNDELLDTYPDWRILQRYALAVLFYSTNGPNWNVNIGWLEYDIHECRWYSRPNLFFAGSESSTITLSPIQYTNPCNLNLEDDAILMGEGEGRYQHLWLWANDVHGTLPAELFLLTTLKTINMNAQEGIVETVNDSSDEFVKEAFLEGDFPDEVVQCTDLEVISLFGHKFKELPPAIGELSSLQYLDFWHNEIDQNISSALFDSTTDLRYINLGENEIYGSLPSFIGGYSNLEIILLNWNFEISGEIPSEVGRLENLRRLDLYRNKITGSLPSEIQGLSMLEYLRLRQNRLTGVLPSWIGVMPQLRTLDIGLNNFAGTIITELARLSNLEYFDLRDNEITGTIPLAMRSMSSLKYLGLSSNDLTGTLPSELCELSNLEYLNVQSNELVGSLPTELQQLSRLTVLITKYNMFNGTIPRQVYFLEDLEELDITGNAHFGIISTELGLLSNLRTLQASGLALTGSIPSEIGNLQYLSFLEVSSTLLSGSIPSEVATLGRLRYVYLNAEFTGRIDSWIGNFVELKHFSVQNTLLSGTIPSVVGTFEQLTNLNLEGNMLSGHLPSELGRLGLLRLRELVFRDNNLTGTIPAELGSLGGNRTWRRVDLRLNSLSGTVPDDLCSLGELGSFSGLGFDCGSQLCGCSRCECIE